MAKTNQKTKPKTSAAKNNASSKKVAVKKMPSKTPKNSHRKKSIKSWLLNKFKAAKNRVKNFLKRRPHRSFRWTRRRDYKRSLKLPGYWAFSRSVRRELLKNRKTFLMLALVYTLIAAVFVGLSSQETFSDIQEYLSEVGGDLFTGGWGKIGEASIIALSTLAGGLTPEMTEAQQIYAGLFAIFLWMTTVWLLRHFLAGNKVRLRDGLYNAGAPLLPTALLSLVLVVQLIPIGLAVIGYGAASATGLLDGGVEAMLFWTAAILLSVLSIYWLSSTFIALVIVTLPGVYPLRALAIAGDMVVGRRLRVLLRLLWLALGIIVKWIIILIPIILLDMGLKKLWLNLEFVPIVPLAIALLSAFTLVWASSYVYLLYRKLVDDESQPA